MNDSVINLFVGGLRKAVVNVSGSHIYKFMKYEVGVHRVQRVPKTEKGGRLHTSTMSVVVLPTPTEVSTMSIAVPPTPIELSTMVLPTPTEVSTISIAVLQHS